MRPMEHSQRIFSGIGRSRRAAASARSTKACGSTSERRSPSARPKHSCRMSDGRAARPAVYSIPTHRSFADSLAAGLIAKFGNDPLRLASGRILLPNNRAVRTITDAFVRASGSGLLLPRLIPIGDPELDERMGGALDRIDEGEPVPPAVDPMERLLTLASIVRGEEAAESLRLAADLARTLDALTIEEVDPTRLRDAVNETTNLARHWE